MIESPVSASDIFRGLSRAKQEKVLRAAMEEFAGQGYRSASVNNVVKAAGISKGSLFQYFGTKRGLFDAVVELAQDRVKNYLRNVRDETSGMPLRQRLEHLLRSGFAFIDNHPLLARIYFQLLQSGDSPYGSSVVAELRAKADAFLADFIRDAKEAGETHQFLEPEKVAFLVNALFETLLRAYYTEFLGGGLGLYRGDAEELDRWVETTLDMVFYGIRARQP